MPSADAEPIAIAEIINRFGDPTAFAERELVVLQNIQSLPIGTLLYARYPSQPGDPESLNTIRETLQATALHGAQAEIDEVDAQLLLGLMDRDRMPRLTDETLQHVITGLENGLANLAKVNLRLRDDALQTILQLATGGGRGRHAVLDRIGELARLALK